MLRNGLVSSEQKQSAFVIEARPVRLAWPYTPRVSTALVFTSLAKPHLC